MRTKCEVVPVPVGMLEDGFNVDIIEVYKRTVTDLRDKGVNPRVMVSPFLDPQ